MLNTLNLITPAAKPPRRARWIKRLVIALALYTVFGFLLLPAIVKWQMVKQLPKFTLRQARVEAVRMNPYAWSVTIRGLTLTEPDGGTFASWSNLYVNFEPLESLANWGWTFQEIDLDTPYGYAAFLTNGQFNFANILTNFPAKTNVTSHAASAPAPPPAVLVHSLLITNGSIEFADLDRPVVFRTKFAPIEVRMKEFTTRPEKESPYAFTATTGEGESFSWSGDFTVVPLSSAGHFQIGGIDLKKYAAYTGDFVQHEIQEGRVDVAATYRVALGPNGMDLVVTNASVAVTNFQVRATDTDDVIAFIPLVKVSGAAANLRTRQASVTSVQTTGGRLTVRRYHDGEFQMLALSKPRRDRVYSRLLGANRPPPARTNSPSPIPAPNEPPWQARVDEISVDDYTLRVLDQKPAQPASLLLDQVRFRLNDFSTRLSQSVRMNLAARWNGAGTINLASTATLDPLAAEADVEVVALDLRPLQPYIDEQVKLTLKSGQVSTKGHATVALNGTNPPALHFTGDVVASDFATEDQIISQEIAKWKEIAVRGIDFTLAPLKPMSARVREVSVDQFVASVVLDTNRQPTLLAILPPKQTNATNAPVPAATAPPPAGGKALPFDVQLGLLSLTNASLRLTDLSVLPNCHFAVQDFGGTVRDLSSAPGTVADMDIHGRMNENAPFSVVGKVKPLFADLSDLLVDLVISNKNTDLTAFTPYMEKFGGYPLAKGKVTVGLRYDVKQGGLKAENSIFIDQLTLGQKNNSPDATKLPVKLGVALLKDRNGRIELDVPLSGRLDDPKFRVGPIVLQVVVNMLTKVATSPFSLLGALVGGGEELSFVEFAPGQSVIGETELAKIDKLGKALYERPALNLEITGAADEAMDRAALAWLKLEHDLKTLRLNELAGKPDAPATVENLKLEGRDYTRLLKAQYRQWLEQHPAAPTNGLPSGDTNAVGVVKTNLLNAPRVEMRKGAEALRGPVKAVSKATNAVASAVDPSAVTRPAHLPPVATDEVLAPMEAVLFQQIEISSNDLVELMQARAKVVHQQLLKTEKVTDDRLFILAPKPADAASKGQSRVNLSLN